MILKPGEVFEQNFVISNETYAGFIQTFKDQNPLHTDENFAKAKGFKGKVMHGNILNGFLSYFVGECLPSKNVIIHSESIIFKNAIYLDDELKLSAEVTEVYESVGAVRIKFNFLNSESKTVAKGEIQIGLLE